MKPLKVTTDDNAPNYAATNGINTTTDGHAITAGYIPNSNPLKDSDWTLEESTERCVTTGGDPTTNGLKRTAIGCCTLQKWRSRLPISLWLPKYSLLDFKGDLVAGLTVGLTVVPQGLAYAAIAEVPLEYGLYSAFMGCFMYTLFGTAKDITLGPTAVLSLMTAAAFPKDATPEDKAHYAVILSFFSGVSQLFLGIFNLGFLINFISAPVISGFTTTSAFIILYGQIKTLTGLKLPSKIWTPSGNKASADSVWEISQAYVMSIRTINGWDTLMGMICLTVLLLMKEMKLPRRPRFGCSKRTWNILREVVRTICVTRYALVIIVATGISYYVTAVLGIKGYLSITSDVNATIPKFGPPDFSWNNHSASASIAAILPSVPMIVLVGALESIAVAKAFAFQFQYRIEPTQELFALGLSNLLCSFFHAYPVTGSFTRSALKAQSGVRTPFGCTWTGAFVLIAMSVISPAFKYVPKSALSAVIIAAILILFEFKIFKDLWLISKKELLAIGTVVVIGFTFSVDYGILAGIGVSMLLLLYPIARPVIIAYFKQSLYSLRPINPTTGKRTINVAVTPQGAIYFPAAEYLKDFFQDEIVTKEYNDVTMSPTNNSSTLLEIAEIKEEIVFDGIHLTASDYTTLRALRSVVMNCKRWNKSIRFVNTPAEILRIVLPKDLRNVNDARSEDGNRMDVSTIDVFSQSTAERMASTSEVAIRSMEATESAYSTSQADLLDEDELEKLDYEQNLPKSSPTLSSFLRRTSRNK